MYYTHRINPKQGGKMKIAKLLLGLIILWSATSFSAVKDTEKTEIQSFHTLEEFAELMESLEMPKEAIKDIVNLNMPLHLVTGAGATECWPCDIDGTAGVCCKVTPDNNRGYGGQAGGSGIGGFFGVPVVVCSRATNCI